MGDVKKVLQKILEELEATARIFLLLHWHNPRVLSEDEASELRAIHYQAP